MIGSMASNQMAGKMGRRPILPLHSGQPSQGIVLVCEWVPRLAFDGALRLEWGELRLLVQQDMSQPLTARGREVQHAKKRAER
eukprot:CAMPEP_0115273638 /NCGR_PEP_ID=MMETSP0270-20121206/55243_1 /TAXON_ID=71861 /ORGANISM="Scrippsiella trochoidea, Strain CCMP3099" /LENGTH=82 /DNA_ID=CAMNT_0002690085 /DNA_START=34 /DNA_END=282 /DNA_ORIENTATION=+